jgi:Prenyltransferase and squalene oxidase repeat
VSWQLASFLALAIALTVGFAWYERDKPPARVLSLVAALAALAVVGRLAFAAFPNVKPTTDIVLFAGYALGAAPGFAVGAVTAIASNVFLSQGPWTVWQMAGWGAVGVGGALLARLTRGRELRRLPLALVCALAGLVFGAWMDVYQWTLASTQDLPSYVAVSTSSLPYNLAHAIGNFVFCLAIGPTFVRALRRYRRRFEVRWEEAPLGPAAAAGAALAVVLAAGLATAGPAEGSTSGQALRYLERAQNRDGGFGAGVGQRSNGLYSGWAGLGLAAARRNPAAVQRRRGRTLLHYVRRHARSLTDVGDVERTVLVLAAAGSSPRRFGGRNLVAELRRRRRGDGSWEGLVNHTAFGVLALRAAGERALASSASFLQAAQNGDGGFGFTARATSDVDDTGAVLQALAAAGRGSGGAARRAVAFLRDAESRDGGFGQMAGRPSNAQSTAWAVQGLVAAGAGGGAVNRALAYLKGLQRRDGSIGYSGTSRQTPVWVTAQALAALRRKPFPLPAVPRHRARHSRRAHRAASHPARVRRVRVAATQGTGRDASARSRVDLHPAAARAGRREEGGGGGPAPGLLAGAAVGALALLALGRRYLAH